MILKIAWRNIRRNKRRSLIVLSSIVVGMITLILNDSFGIGMINGMLNNQIKSHTSHLQIHHAGFNDNKTVSNLINDDEKITKLLDTNKLIQTYSKRIVLFGLISSADNSAGTTIYGVEPEKESKITDISQSIIKGKYLSGKTNEIIIGSKLADKLEANLGDKIVAVVADIHGKVNSELFRLVGIFNSGNSELDKMNCYISLSNASQMIGSDGRFHEIAMILKDSKESFNAKKSIINGMEKINLNLKNYDVQTFQELLPLMMSYVEIYNQSILIFYVIIGLAVLFGIVNTMLMSVYERIHEFGILMSIGLKNSKLFIMVIIEAFLLGMIGTVIGLAIGTAIYIPLANTGIDLSRFSESMSSFGLKNIIYPEINLNMIVNILIVMPISAIAGAIYPALKSIKFQPSDAVRHI